jgi:hypothetical protein
MMMMGLHRRKSRGLAIAQLILLLFSTFGGSHNYISTVLVGWVIEKGADIMNE